MPSGRTSEVMGLSSGKWEHGAQGEGGLLMPSLPLGKQWGSYDFSWNLPDFFMGFNYQQWVFLKGF